MMQALECMMGTGVLLELFVAVLSIEKWWVGCSLVVHIREWLGEHSKGGEWMGEHSKAEELMVEDMPCVVTGIAVVGCMMAC